MQWLVFHSFIYSVCETQHIGNASSECEELILAGGVALPSPWKHGETAGAHTTPVWQAQALRSVAPSGEDTCCACWSRSLAESRKSHGGSSHLSLSRLKVSSKFKKRGIQFWPRPENSILTFRHQVGQSLLYDITDGVPLVQSECLVESAAEGIKNPRRSMVERCGRSSFQVSKTPSSQKKKHNIQSQHRIHCVMVILWYYP